MSKFRNKLVSVIIPKYQRSKYFIEALESVLRQTHTNFEIFITDNRHDTDTFPVMNCIYVDLFSNMFVSRYLKIYAADNLLIL